MVLDFSWLPPEINSALIFGGAGSGSLLAAAQAWEGLAQDLAASAESFGSVLTQLASGTWAGPASIAMAAAAAPYVSWLNSAAAQAGLAAGQASAAAAAFETAQALTVHPALVTANRVSLGSLVATNILGQNTPAIFATEFNYVEMWAQDVAAMLGYHGGAAAVAESMTPFAAAPVSLPGLFGDALTGVTAGVSELGAQTMAVVETGGALAGSLMSSGGLSQVVQMAMYPASMAISPLMSVIQMAAQGGGAAGMAGTGAAAAAGLAAADVPKMVGDVKPIGGGGIGGLGGAMGADLGKARMVGAMSVPPTWQGSMPGRMGTAAMSGLGAAGAAEAAAMAGAGAAGGGGMPMMPMPMGMGGAGGGMPGGPLGRGGASPHVQQNRPSVIPRIGVG